MPGPGFEKGNTAAAKEKRFRAAMVRALERRSRADGLHALDQIADQWLDVIFNVDEPAFVRMAAIKDLRDTLDGKPAQALEHSGEVSTALQVVLRPQLSQADWLRLYGSEALPELAGPSE